MAECSPRSCVRDINGPRGVDAGQIRDKTKTPGRYVRDNEDRIKSKKAGEKRPRLKTDPAVRQKSSRGHTLSLQSERPTFCLDILNQPQKAVTLGIDVATSVLVTLSFAGPEAVPARLTVDTNRLVGVVSLVAETSNGDRVPMEPDTMVADQLVDSLRPVPDDFAASLAQQQPCRLALGYLSFKDLLIRQSGYYRVRISLVQVPGAGPCAGSSASTITSLDSDVIKVERRLVGAQFRRMQRPQA